MSVSPPRTLCLGDALVDRFSPHFGGAAANVALVPGVETALAFVTVDGDGDSSYHLHREQPELIVRAVGGRIERAAADAAGLFISTNTLVGAAERALTMRARELMLARERPVVFDANLRLHRWSSRADAAASAKACVPRALLVRANREEAEAMTGEPDPERAAVGWSRPGRSWWS